MYFAVISTAIHAKLLNQFFHPKTLSTSLNLIRLIFKWAIIQESCRLLKKTLLTLLFLIIVASRSNGCWLAGHTCSDGHISSFLSILQFSSLLYIMERSKSNI